jgi:hypothetical protein
MIVEIGGTDCTWPLWPIASVVEMEIVLKKPKNGRSALDAQPGKRRQ